MGQGNDPTGDSEDFATLLAEFDGKDRSASRRGPRVGELVRCRVVSIGQDSAFVDLGGKSEGVLDLGELRDDSGAIRVKVGDTVEARVVALDRSGSVVLRIALGRGPDARGELEQAAALGVPVEGQVTAINKGGAEVRVAGVRGFCPASQLDLHFVDKPEELIGQTLKFRITRFEGGGRGRDPNIVLSRRALLEEEQQARAAETRAHLEVGAVLPGTVTSLRDFGAFVDLGGIEGLLHVSELGFARVAHPKDVLVVGQRVDVQVKKIEKTGDPRRPEKISLSIKSLERDPWQDVAARFSEGTRHRGTVARVETFGAFVELAPGIEGLVHVSELGADRRVAHAREVVRPGQSVEVTVLKVEPDKRRVSLSMQAIDEAAAAEEAADLAAVQREARGRGLGTLGDLMRGKKG